MLVLKPIRKIPTMKSLSIEIEFKREILVIKSDLEFRNKFTKFIKRIQCLKIRLAEETGEIRM